MGKVGEVREAEKVGEQGEGRGAIGHRGNMDDKGK